MIYLNERLAITADKYQYILGTPRERPRACGEGTETIMANPSYHRTLIQALRAAVQREMRRGVESGDIQTLRDYLQQLEAIANDLEAKIKPLDENLWEESTSHV